MEETSKTSTPKSVSPKDLSRLALGSERMARAHKNAQAALVELAQASGEQGALLAELNLRYGLTSMDKIDAATGAIVRMELQPDPAPAQVPERPSGSALPRARRKR